MTEVSTRFNPREGEPYGRCVECEGVTFETPELASAHMNETFEARTTGRQGHRVRITNPTRARRIESYIESIVDNAIAEAIDRISDLTHGSRIRAADATEAEITEALSHSSDEFGEAWAEYMAENGEDAS